MANVKLIAATKTALTSASLATLAAGNYCVSSAYNNTANDQLDLIIETTVATTNTPSGNKQVVVFAQASYDNSVWQTGPTTGSITIDEPLLTFLGTIPLATASVTETKAFSIAAAYAGIVPPYVRIIHKNDLGVALTTGTVATVEYVGEVV